jgi:phenylacetic acid degradation operon negative regulatory protein
MSYIVLTMSTVPSLPKGIAAALAAAPTTDFIYSSVSFLRGIYRRQVPGTWFAEALGEIGVDPQAVRQALFRLTKTGVLVAERHGRVNWYAPAPSTVEILDAGRARTRPTDHEAWDGQWTVVHFRLDDADRERRDRLRDVLLVHGFGRLRSGVYIHPRDKTASILGAADQLNVADRIAVFRGTRRGPPTDAALVHQLWDLPSVAARYRQFIRRYERMAGEPTNDLSDVQSFAVRFAYMFELFRLTWDDPDLPVAFLPEDWPGQVAREVAERLRDRVRPGAVRFATAIARRVGVAEPSVR